MKHLCIALLCIIPFGVMAQVSDSSIREVKLAGAINFRDIGGYATKDGHHIKWKKIYRSAAINKLTDQDLEKLEGLSLAWIGDFRGPYEVKAAPDRLPKSAVWVSLPAGSENIGDSNYIKNMAKTMGRESSLTGFYSNLAPFKARYKPVFDEMLALSKDSAMLIHCTAGKDRTGIGTALILYALGVDENTIVQDYLATNYYRAPANETAVPAMVKGYGISEESAKNMLAAKESYINATFNAIKSQYGSLDKYLEHEMGMDKNKIKQLRSIYTTE